MNTGIQSARKLGLWPLIAATYFMVSGGPYGLEELIQKSGYVFSIFILLATPLIWSLPTALMVGELSSAIPEEGGFYVWVKRALGPFWGFQEAWLSLMASVFDMAIYPTLFVLYLGRFWPGANEGHNPILIGIALITACTVWNLLGSRAVGGASELLTFFLLGPFLVMVVLVLIRPGISPTASTNVGMGGDMLGGILIAMWNYMGWDNASTIAGEVERPQRTYPLAMMLAVTLVAVTYVLPVLAARYAGIDPSAWTTGSWVEAATSIGGRSLGFAVVIGGMVCAVGMFNALVLSYSRVPLALAEDGYLPAIFSKRLSTGGPPWVAVLACGAIWTLSLGLSFERLIMLDILLYGLSLLLEFVALIALRWREPALLRPFKVPGGIPVAIFLGVPPAILMGIALIRNRNEQMGGISALWIGLGLIAAGPLAYLVADRFRVKT